MTEGNVNSDDRDTLQAVRLSGSRDQLRPLPHQRDVAAAAQVPNLGPGQPVRRLPQGPRDRIGCGITQQLAKDALRRVLAIYPELSADRPGLMGAICVRAEAQVIRLALIYALREREAQ